MIKKFLKAQNGVYEVALQEIKNGCKMSHWMWFIFPQIKGLGHSFTARHFELKDFNAAREYMQNETLRNRLLEISQAVYDLNADDIEYVMGYPDNLKLKSSMTLFALVAPEYPIFKMILDRYFDGEMCEFTKNLYDQLEN